MASSHRRRLAAWAAAATLGAGLCGLPARAQPTEFPPGAVALTEDSLQALAGKRFKGNRSDGQYVALAFGPDRDLRVEWSRGILDGKARLEGSRLCGDYRRAVHNDCNEVRLLDDTLYYKRNANGEVMALKLQ